MIKLITINTPHNLRRYHCSLFQGWGIEYPSQYKLADKGCGNISNV